MVILETAVADPGREVRGLKPPLSDLITSAEAERTFSLMRRIKTFARSTMCEERFADLGVIAMNYGERITVDDVARAFVEKNPRRLFDASLFTADEKHYN